MAPKGRINGIFAMVVALLVAAALTGMYLNRNQPVILEAAAPPTAGAGQLPENHPPVNAGAQIASLEQASQNDPKNADLRTQVGNAYYDAGQYQKAIEAYQESLRLRPQDPNVETDMATCYHFLGRHDQALDILARVLMYRPGFAQALFNRGVILQVGKSDSEGAIAAWEELLRTNPSFPQKADIEERLRQLKSPGK